MRSPRYWLNLTQFLLLGGCSGYLPLDVEGGLRERDKLPVEFAGNGGDFGAGARAGAPGVPWSSGVMQEPGQNLPICGDTRVQPPETCDRTNLNGASCATLGFNGGGTLLCNPTTCTYDTIMCRMSVNQSRSNPGRPAPDFGADAGTDDAG